LNYVWVIIIQDMFIRPDPEGHGNWFSLKHFRTG